jgi:signal transduction histidine kinase
VILGVSIVFVIIACAGGNLSPGAFWLVGTPMVFGLFYGTRGVWMGALVMAATFIAFVGLNHFHLLPNLVAEFGDYEQVKLINLIGFGIYNVLISHYFIQLEEKAKKELREQRQETEDLLRILVHDIANPINAIQLMTHAVKSGRKDPEEILGLVDGALEDLAGIVQQVRKLRALKDGKLALALSHVAIQSALTDTINLLAQQAQHKGVALQLDIDSTPAYVVTDLALLKSIIFANIINNAIKFSYPGQTVCIRLTVSSAWVTLVIEDHGIGIPAQLLPHIFDPAQPTTRPGTSGEQGTGFGMPLVKTLLAKLNGDIELESNQDSGTSGTVVTVRLPRTIESL